MRLFKDTRPNFWGADEDNTSSDNDEVANTATETPFAGQYVVNAYTLTNKTLIKVNLYGFYNAALRTHRT